MGQQISKEIDQETAAKIEQEAAQDPELSYLTEWFRPGQIPTRAELLGSVCDQVFVFGSSYLHNILGENILNSDEFNPFGLFVAKRGNQYAVDIYSHVIQGAQGNETNFVPGDFEPDDLIGSFPHKPHPIYDDQTPGVYRTDVRKHLRAAGVARHLLAMSIPFSPVESALFYIDNWRTTRGRHILGDDWNIPSMDIKNSDTQQKLRELKKLLRFSILATTDEVELSSDLFADLMSSDKKDVREFALRLAPKNNG